VLSSELSVPLELFYFLSLISPQITRGERSEKKQTKRKKITLKTHQSSNKDSTFRKISTRWIQQLERKSQTMNRVSHTIRLKVLGLTCLWATCVTCSGHNWWSFLVSLDSSHFDLSNNTSNVVIEVLMCLQYHFFYTFFILFLLDFVSIKSLDVICDFLKYIVFLNIFYIVYIYIYKNPKKTLWLWRQFLESTFSEPSPVFPSMKASV